MNTTEFSLTIDRATLRAALLFAARNDVRHYLNSICLEIDETGDARLIATNGHALAVVDLAAAAHMLTSLRELRHAAGRYMIPRELVATIKKGTRGKKMVTIQVAGQTVTLTDADGVSVGGTLIDGRYPDWERVIPSADSMTGEPGSFDAAYLGNVRAALIELGSPHGTFSMRQSGPEVAGLVADVPRGLLAIIMPVRTSGAPTGADVDAFRPRRAPTLPQAVIETATGGNAYPCDPAQNVRDRRAPAAAPTTPAPCAPVSPPPSGEEIDFEALLADEPPTARFETDLTCTLDGMFARYLPNTPQGEDAWREIAAKNEGDAVIFRQFAESTNSQLRQAGYSVTVTDPPNSPAPRAPDSVMASGEEKPEHPSGDHEAPRAVAASEALAKIKTVELTDRANKTVLFLAGIPKGCDTLHPLTYGALGVAEARAAALRADGIAARVRGTGPYSIIIDPLGEVRAEACPTLLPGRWIPGGAENAERIAFDAALGAEVWLMPAANPSGKLSLIAYSGKRGKHDGHYTVRTRERALTWAGEYMGNLQATAQRKAADLANKVAKRAAGHKLKVGDVLRSVWGYDQTNVDYYQVTQVIGKRTVEIRKIGSQSEETGFMQGACVPAPGRFIGAPMRKMVSDYDGESVRITSFASAKKITPQKVAGVDCYPADHWTAYA